MNIVDLKNVAEEQWVTDSFGAQQVLLEDLNEAPDIISDRFRKGIGANGGKEGQNEEAS